ncbi:uncharacterized protein LOC105421583 [Amborella trichopoda]|uniref:uncharacterized protein LOC105421583 n=1 Tax=Amborella trichopoda TaxID=13333 RepID=UPI0005D393EC|nr:uncharacterized protein LOC105421583 [Amborella trichopoda]|eukprot:XP_011627824.1 uncharacterized protein LOC105421583 [Amborella trichopoda]
MSRAHTHNASSSNDNTEALSEFYGTLGAMTQIMKESMPVQSTPTLEQNDSSVLERFRRLAPPNVLGQGGLEKVERWKRQIEKILEVLHFSSEKNVRLGSFMLEGEAEHRWDSVTRSWGESGTETTWENFLTAFDEKYFPDSIKEIKEVEFIELQQRGMAVEQ